MGIGGQKFIRNDKLQSIIIQPGLRFFTSVQNDCVFLESVTEIGYHSDAFDTVPIFKTIFQVIFLRSCSFHIVLSSSNNFSVGLNLC